MIKNYLKTFFRNTFKNPFYSTINILGLAVGIACSLVALLYILNETSYNRGFQDYEKIYRIGAGLQSEMLNDSMPATLYQVAPAIVEQIPEVVSATRFVTWYKGSLIKANNEYYPEVDALISDSSMLDVFSFKILHGDPNTFLKSPTKVAITKSLANKIFKTESPLQQIIHFEGVDLEVGWILEDPENSMVDFELLANFEFVKEFKEWIRLDVHTFFKTKEALSAEVESKIRKVSDQIILDAFGEWAGVTNSPIQPLKDLYLKSNLGWEVGRRGSLRTLYIFGFLAGIILLIAVINYVNLLTSRSEYRNKEVGIRKVTGADKKKLRVQFLGESVILTIIALLIGFVIVEFISYLVNGKLHLNISLFEQSTIWLFVIYILSAVLIGVISGIYPAFIMASYSPLQVIKGIFDSKGNSNLLKIILVIVQFSISTLLIIAIFIFNSQINFLKNKDLGFEAENLLVLPECTEKMQAGYESIRQELKSFHHIKEVTASQSIPGWGRSGQSIRKKTDDPSKVIAIAENRVQDFYTETMGIEIVKGRAFDPAFDDNRSILINEATAKLLDVDDPIGLEVITNRESVIIGVIKDFHYYATTEEVRPLYLSNYADWFFNITIKVAPEDKLGSMQFIKKVVMKHDPDYYWNYFYIEDMFANKYKVEERLFTLIFWGSGIALLLSVLGLFALTSYTVSKRFKEIGIRKTFGASINSIVNKLNKDIIRWVLLTNLIAWPIAYFVMNNWLQNYPYKVEINFLYFILASIISLLIAWLTISIQAFKAARMNPVDAIRYE